MTVTTDEVSVRLLTVPCFVFFPGVPFFSEKSGEVYRGKGRDHRLLLPYLPKEEDRKTRTQLRVSLLTFSLASTGIAIIRGTHILELLELRID